MAWQGIPRNGLLRKNCSAWRSPLTPPPTAFPLPLVSAYVPSFIFGLLGASGNKNSIIHHFAMFQAIYDSARLLDYISAKKISGLPPYGPIFRCEEPKFELPKCFVVIEGCNGLPTKKTASKSEKNSSLA